MVKKAVVLAAGLGTRLRPLTAAVPKPLLPVWGEPMLARVVELLRGWGVEEIAVNCHYLHGQVEAWCAANGCKAVYEPEILGTGGVLNPLRDWIGGDDFILVNGDIVVEGIETFPFKENPKGVYGAEIIGQCVMSETEGPRTIEAEPEAGLVTCWKSPDPGCAGTYTYCGIALLKSAILDFVAPQGFSTIVEAYERAAMAGKFVKGIIAPELMWTDAGTVESFIDLNRAGDENAFAELPQIAEMIAHTKARRHEDEELRLRSQTATASEDGAAEAVAVVSRDLRDFDSSCDITPIEFLGARGSDRAFFRRGGEVFIIYDDEKRGENARYAGHARWLKERGVPVPEVRGESAAMKTLVMENAGAEDLKAVVEKPGADKIAAYAPVVEALARFNALDCGGLELEPAFGPDLWKWERDLFKEHCLMSRFHIECPKAVEDELERVAERLEREPKALVHRDFQSTNVIWKNGEFKFIDFQGMREGPAAYDLASLLYDPYVELSEKEREALAALYMKSAADLPRSVAPGEGALPVAAVQRLAQALGAYGRLASVGKPEFGRFVLPALVNLLAAADEAGLDAVGALAEDLIAKENSFTGHRHK